MSNPQIGLISSQFISVQKFHAAEMLSDSTSATTYGTPLNLGKVLRQVQIQPTNNTVQA